MENREAKVHIKKKKNRLFDLILVIIIFAGFAVIAYPRFSDWWNSLHQSRAIEGYTRKVEELDQDKLKSLWKDAEHYNKKLTMEPDRFHPSREEERLYNKLLDVSGTGIIGQVIIPKIHVDLPIYHGSREEVLQVAVGHLEGSSLPIGGRGSHAVLSGHRGLPSAKLFSDIDQLEKGDTFMVKVLNKTLHYQVDRIRIVLPEEMEDLAIDEREDYVTLLTCTPYGVNTHRLLVRGKRTTGGDAVSGSREIAKTGDRNRIMLFIILILLSGTGLIWLLQTIFRKKRSR